MKFSVCACDRDLPAAFPFPLRGSYEHCARLASQIGFDAIELQIQDPKHYDGEKLRREFDRFGIQISSVTTGLAYTFEGLSMSAKDAKVRRETVERLKRQLDLAKTLDSKILLGIIRGRMEQGEAQECFEDRLTDSMWQLLEYAGQIGSGVIFEHINRRDGDVFCSTERTMAFIEKFHSPDLFFNLDTYHMLTEDPDPVGAVNRCIDKLELFHVSDVERQLPDDKHFDFSSISNVLKKLDYQRWATIECVPLPDTETATRLGFEYLQKVFGL